MVEEMYCQKNWDFLSFRLLCIYVLGNWAKNTIIPGAQSLIDVIWASAELCSPSGSRLSIQAISRDSLLSGGSLHLGCSPLLLSIFGSTGIILCYCLRLPPSLQWCAGKCLTTTSGWRAVLICSACQLWGCKYSHCGRFQATSDLTVSSRNSWRCINQSQPASARHYATHLVTRSLEMNGLPSTTPADKTEVFLPSYPWNESEYFYLLSCPGRGGRATFAGAPVVHAISLFLFWLYLLPG